MTGRIASILIIGALAYGCAKDPEVITVADLTGKDSTENWSAISEKNPERAKTLRAAIERLTRHDSLSKAASWKIADVERNEKEWQTYAAPRVELYTKATDAIRSRLKVPSSAKFGTFDGIDNDTVSITFSGADSATVRGLYQAQNLFGTYLPGNYTANFVRRDGKWGWEWSKTDTPSEYLDIIVN